MSLFNPFGLAPETAGTTVNLSVTAANIAEAYELLDTKIDQVMNEDVDYVVQSMEVNESEDGSFVFKAVIKVKTSLPVPPPPVQNDAITSPNLTINNIRKSTESDRENLNPRLAELVNNHPGLAGLIPLPARKSNG